MTANGETMILFGGVPRGYLETWEITSDLAFVATKLHVYFEEVTLDALANQYRGLDDAQQADAQRLAHDSPITP